MDTKYFRKILILFFWIGIALPASAQVPELINNEEFRPKAQAAVDSIYNFNFSGGDQQLAEWKKRYPDHALWTLFDGIELWWKVLSDLGDTGHDEQFFTTMKKANYRAGKLLHRQPGHTDALLIRAISNGYIARQHANRDEWITSLNYGRKAMNAYEYLLDHKSGLNDLKLAEGLKFYYSAYLREEYPIVKTVSWALPDGDKEKGLDLIHKASQEAVFASAEATYFLGNINYNHEQDYKRAVRNFEDLYRRYPHNNYYARILAKSYYKQHRYKEALSFIDKTLAKWKEKDLPFRDVLEEELWTWKGRILERRGKKEQALKFYQMAFAKAKKLPNTENRSFYVASGYLAGEILYERQNFAKAKSYLKQVLEAKAESDYHDRARNLLAKMS